MVQAMMWENGLKVKIDRISWEIMRKDNEVWQKLRKYGKRCESMHKAKKVL